MLMFCRRIPVFLLSSLSIIGTAAFPPPAYTQSRGQSFEATAIHPSPPGTEGMRFNLNKGALVASNVTVRRLIWGAYDVSAFQIVGGPGWVDTEHYDINATAGQTGEISRERLAQMLKDLLANRFGLRLHSETRNLAAYALLIDKNVPKLTENTGSAVPGISMNEASGRAQIAATSVSMAKLAITLGNQLGRAVIDKTGMEGTYDFRLEWNPDQATASSAPSLFTALREQLGLRLESQKAQVEVLVIDNLEKPSQN